MICTRHSTNLASSRNVEGENASLQVDMPHSKTPLLKLPNTELGSLVPSLRTADVLAVVEATTANMSAVRRLRIRWPQS